MDIHVRRMANISDMNVQAAVPMWLEKTAVAVGMPAQAISRLRKHPETHVAKYRIA